MAVQDSDIKVRLSTQSGAAGNSTASTPAASIGKYMSTTDLVDASVENLFANITAAEAATGKTVYRCVFVYNAHGSQTWQGVKAWIVSQIAGGGDIAIGLDPAGSVANNSGSAQAAVPANDTTAPTGVTFSQPTSEGDALSLGNIVAGNCYAVWARLVVPPDVAALNLDDAIIRFKGQSDP